MAPVLCCLLHRGVADPNALDLMLCVSSNVYGVVSGQLRQTAVSSGTYSDKFQGDTSSFVLTPYISLPVVGCWFTWGALLVYLALVVGLPGVGCWFTSGVL